MAVLINKIISVSFFFSLFKLSYSYDIISIMHNYQNINLFLLTNFNLFKIYDIFNFFFFFKEKKNNFFLQNVLSLYHPVFLYLYFVCFTKLFFFKVVIYYFKRVHFFLNKFFLLTVSLILSSLWSGQELF